MNGVFQLTDIARPAMGHQAPTGLVRQGLFGHAVGGGVLLGEELGQDQDVAGPFAQGRQAQIDHVQAVEQVFAEGPVLDRLGQVAVGGGQDADVHADGLGAADPVDLALLNGPQQLGLQAGVHLRDFVQQQGAAIGLLELADAAGQRAGEGALLVTEQFAFQQVLGDGGAVDRDERLGGPAGLLVDVAGDHLLTRTAFAGDQDGGVGGRHLVGELQHGLHGRIAHHHRAVVVGHGGENRGDQLGVRRQGNELLGPGADRRGGLGRLGADPAGHHRHPDALGLVGCDQGGDVEVIVHQQQVGPLAGPQGVGGLRDGLHMAHLGAGAHRHLHRRGELSVQFSDDQKPHVQISLRARPP